ncbi:MAG: TonB-dependent receptor, partial [Acidobacteriota bacterium]|nr:TonB-dependent receptor [Acidobacteriota bacterium]
MNRTITRLGLTGLALVAGAVAYAQSPTTGMITGKVTVSGNPAAGAKVILSGPALQGARTVVTETDGSFRFSFVPSGQGYQLVVSKSGSETVSSKNITVEPWGNLARNFKLAAAGATVEVFAAPTAVTVDNTTTVDSRTFSAEALQSIPLNNRDYMAAAYLAPGVVDSGRGQANPNMSGATGFENNYIVDGLNVTDPLLGTNNTHINTLAVESVQIQSGGFEPEYGRATGGVISVVTKTGSNDFHGDLELTLRPKSGIAKATAQGALAFNAARIAEANNTTSALWVGGPLVKDKLWYSIGFSSDATNTERSYGMVYFHDPDLTINNPRTVPAGTGGTPALPAGYSNNGTSYDLKDQTQALTTKLTFSLNTDNTVELGYNNIRRTADTNILGMTFSNLAATTKFHENVDTISLNWRSAISSTWLLDVRAGSYKRKTFYDEGGQFGQAFVAGSL